MDFMVVGGWLELLAEPYLPVIGGTHKQIAHAWTACVTSAGFPVGKRHGNGLGSAGLRPVMPDQGFFGQAGVTGAQISKEMLGNAEWPVKVTAALNPMTNDAPNPTRSRFAESAWVFSGAALAGADQGNLDFQYLRGGPP